MKNALAHLPTLKLDVAGKIERREPVTGLGLPPGYPEPQRLGTDACLSAWE